MTHAARLVACLLWLAPLVSAQETLENAPSRAPATVLRTVATPQMAPVVAAWADLVGGVRIQPVELDPVAAVAALYRNRADVIPLNRLLTAAELRRFKDERGYEPAFLHLGYEVLAVVANRRAPTIAGLSMAQLEAIYAASSTCHGQTPIRQWGALGAAGNAAAERIVALADSPDSPAYALFKTVALCGGVYGDQVRTLHGTASVAQLTAITPNALGVVETRDVTSAVNLLPLAGSTTEPIYYHPTPEEVAAGHYPLARPIYLYFAHPAGRPLGVALLALIRAVYSDAGRYYLAREGIAPLSAEQQQAELTRLGL